VTRDEVQFLLHRVRAAWEMRPPTPEVLDEWDRALRSYPASDGHGALDRLIANETTRAPNLSTFVGHVKAMRPPTPSVVVFRGPDADPDEPDPDPPYDGPTPRGRNLALFARMILAHPPIEEDR
jgi:hypothetical protein